MLEKRYEIINHFYYKFQERAKNHFPRMRHKNIANKIDRIMKNVDTLDNLFCNKGVYFLPTRLSREGKNPFYILIKDNGTYLALISIYTHDMFMKECNNKKH